MIVTISEPRFTALIQQLEGINDTPDEIMERIQHYASRLAVHLQSGFGLQWVGLVSQRGTVADFRINPITSALGKITAGLTLLNPICVTVERHDLPVLIENKMIETTLWSSWDHIAGQFHKILPGELQTRLNDLAWKAVGGRIPTDEEVLPAEMQEQNFQDWLLTNGLTDPSANSRARDQRREEQIRLRKEADEKRFAERSRDTNSNWFVREISE